MTPRLGLGVVAAAAILASSIVPYGFPPSEVVLGASYELGFNNSISFLLYAVLALAAGALCGTILRSEKLAIPRTWGQWPGRSSVILAGVLVAHLLVFVALYASKGRFLFADAIYLQVLAYRMELGEFPYIDFGAYYGPAMLYPIHWLAGAFGLDAGYGIAFIATCLLGLVLLFAILHRLLGRPGAADIWFVVLAGGLFNPLATLNLTFFRFLLPLFVYFIAYDAAHGRSRWAVMGTGILLGFAVAYSNEVALLSLGAVGLTVFAALVDRPPFVARARPESRRRVDAGRVALRGAGILALGVLLAVASLVLVDVRGRALLVYPETALSYISGAYNVPVYPNLPFLLLLGVTIVALGVAFRGLALAHAGNATAWQLLGIGAVALAAQRAAFGAFEVSHIAAFGLPAFLLALTAVEGHGAKSLRGALLVGFLVCWAIPLQYYNVSQIAPHVLTVLSRTAAPSATNAPPAPDRASVESSIAQLVATVGSDRPFFMPGLEYYSLPVYRQARLRYPTYESHILTSRTPAGISRMIAEIRSAGAIVLMWSSELTSGANASADGRRPFDVVTGTMTADWPFTPVGARSQARLYAPFYEFLRRDYRVLSDRDGLIALGPRIGN